MKSDEWFLHGQANRWEVSAQRLAIMAERAKSYNADVARHLMGIAISHRRNANILRREAEARTPRYLKSA